MREITITNFKSFQGCRPKKGWGGGVQYTIHIYFTRVHNIYLSNRNADSFPWIVKLKIKDENLVYKTGTHFIIRRKLSLISCYTCFSV